MESLAPSNLLENQWSNPRDVMAFARAPNRGVKPRVDRAVSSLGQVVVFAGSEGLQRGHPWNSNFPVKMVSVQFSSSVWLSLAGSTAEKDGEEGRRGGDQEGQ